MKRSVQWGRWALSLGLAATAIPTSSYAQLPARLTAVQHSPSDRIVVVPSQGSAATTNGSVSPSAAYDTINNSYSVVSQPTVSQPTAQKTAGGTVSSTVVQAPTAKPDDKKKTEALTKAMKGAYHDPFYANDFSYLNDPAYSGPYFLGDSLKGMANGKLDFGGEFRSRYHHENNMRGFGLTGVDDQFWLSRLRMYSSYRMTDNIRFYGEYLYADSGGEDFAPRAIEENRGEAQNLFFDAKLYDSGAGTVSARLGRQELLLGNQRLVSPLDWANTRRTFDGYRLTYASKELDGDLFYTNPVLRVPATAGFNEWDSSNNNQSFYGAYLSRKGLDVGTIDAYYLGYDNQDANFSYHTLGSRLAGEGDFFMYETEGGVQFGDNSNGSNHNATFFTAGLGRKLDWAVGRKGWKPTVWGWYDYASGGNGALVSRGDNGFDHQFPLAHKYNGFMDLFGRRNLNDVNLQFIAPVGEKVSLLMWYHYFFLDQATTPYGVTMNPFNAGNAAGSKDLGHEIDFLCTYNINPRDSMLLGYSHFSAGKYYDTTAGVPTNANADFFYMQYQTRF